MIITYLSQSAFETNFTETSLLCHSFSFRCVFYLLTLTQVISQKLSDLPIMNLSYAETCSSFTPLTAFLSAFPFAEIFSDRLNSYTNFKIAVFSLILKSL